MFLQNVNYRVKVSTNIFHTFCWYFITFIASYLLGKRSFEMFQELCDLQYLIANLAFSDLISCVFGSIEILELSEEMRNVVSHITRTAMFVSLLSIFSIAIDRYILTVHPFRHRVLLNGRRIAICIVSIWFLSFSLFMVKYLAFGVNQMDNKINDATFIIIVVITSLIYVLIYFSLRKQRREISHIY